LATAPVSDASIAAAKPNRAEKIEGKTKSNGVKEI
jgi:hypothetical protein